MIKRIVNLHSSFVVVMSASTKDVPLKMKGSSTMVSDVQSSNSSRETDRKISFGVDPESLLMTGAERCTLECNIRVGSGRIFQHQIVNLCEYCVRLEIVIVMTNTEGGTLRNDPDDACSASA